MLLYPSRERWFLLAEVCCEKMPAKRFSSRLFSRWTRFGQTESRWFRKKIRKPVNRSSVMCTIHSKWRLFQEQDYYRKLQFTFREEHSSDRTQKRWALGSVVSLMHIIEYWFSCHLTAARASSFCIFTKNCENKRCFERNWNQISEGQGTDEKAIAAGFRCAPGQRAAETAVVDDAFLSLSPRELIIQMWPGL